MVCSGPFPFPTGEGQALTTKRSWIRCIKLQVGAALRRPARTEQLQLLPRLSFGSDPQPMGQPRATISMEN